MPNYTSAYSRFYATFWPLLLSLGIGFFTLVCNSAECYARWSTVEGHLQSTLWAENNFYANLWQGLAIPGVSLLVGVLFSLCRRTTRRGAPRYGRVLAGAAIAIVSILGYYVLATYLSLSADAHGLRGLVIDGFTVSLMIIFGIVKFIATLPTTAVPAIFLGILCGWYCSSIETPHVQGLDAASKYIISGIVAEFAIMIITVSLRHTAYLEHYLYQTPASLSLASYLC